MYELRGEAYFPTAPSSRIRKGWSVFITLKDWKARSSKNADTRKELTWRARNAFSLGDNDVIVINELACSDPGCPDVETVILIMRECSPTRALKISKPMSDVSDEDLVEVAQGTILP